MLPVWDQPGLHTEFLASLRYSKTLRYSKYKVSLSYMVSLRSVQATPDPVSRNQTKQTRGF